MNRLLLIAFLGLLGCTGGLRAEVCRGRVTGESGEPMSFVSVYVKDNPYVGTTTGEDGTFSLDVPEAERGEDLIFSFIGYRTAEVPVATVAADTAFTLVLVEQPVMLDGAEVSARISKKESRKIKKAVLARFIAQLEADFPPRQSEYRVVSSYQGAQDDRRLLRHELIGLVTEYAEKRRGGGDSITVVAESIKEHTTEEVEQGYAVLNDLAAEQVSQYVKKNKRKLKGQPAVTFPKRDLDHQMMKMHRYLWGGYTGELIGMLNTDKLAMWDYTTVGDLNILTYTDKRNYIGIVKMNLQIHFYIDPSTLGIEKIAQSLEGEVHIPFGYKLKEEELELVNILQMHTDTLDRYRARHVYADVKRNVFFRMAGGHRTVQEKNIDVKGTVADRKDHRLNYSAQAKVVVTGQPVITPESRH